MATSVLFIGLHCRLREGNWGSHGLSDHPRVSREHARNWRKRRAGLTLVELLIVIAIIAALVALLLPAVLSGRAAARRMQCMSQMRQIGLALHAFEARTGYYPGYRDVFYGGHVSQQPGQGLGLGSWIYLILGDLDESALDNLAKSGLMGANQHIDTLLCPDDRIDLYRDELHQGLLSYAGNAGIPDRDMHGLQNTRRVKLYRSDSRANGVFHRIKLFDGPHHLTYRPWMRVSNHYVSRHDGTSKTILISENVDAKLWQFAREYSSCIVWDADKEERAFFKSYRYADSPIVLGEDKFLWETERPYHINERRGERPGGKSMGSNSSLDFSRPSSFHRGNGVNMIFCDGSGRFISEEIPYAVYVQLMTPRGALAVIDAQTGFPLRRSTASPCQTILDCAPQDGKHQVPQCQSHHRLTR
jgi:prepilin-type N-terminal cleavage/methylation domain-containing protein